MASTRQLALRGLLRLQPRHALRRQAFLAPITRSYYRSSTLSKPFKDDQERTDLKPRTYDYTMSGSDYDASDHHAGVSFNPDIKTPEEAMENCQRETMEMHYEASPLEFSPANREISAAVEEGSDSAAREPKIKSGKRSAQKAGTALPRTAEPIHHRIG
ncbi:hypothetical protein B0T16DRAFT_461066 [Cercophora newfieldiana]|uniref:Uncharacterized protein n=1 Tax=Cercophora newfieldiana TaxID=92897 RepID=A0AA40CL09_9PEZI|nr:hypothetical protein B0T16DRAFT_461066 [Cercophora newfieldiana]